MIPGPPVTGPYVYTHEYNNLLHIIHNRSFFVRNNTIVVRVRGGLLVPGRGPCSREDITGVRPGPTPNRGPTPVPDLIFSILMESS